MFMKKHLYLPVLPVVLASVLLPQFVHAQAFDISTFDGTAAGPWSAINGTTLMVPKVPNGSIKLDSTITSAEYGGSTGATVTPGVNAWILDFPGDRNWEGATDSSFTYYLAHDDDYLYVGVDAKDDVVNSDDVNSAFWKDDAIEIVVDALNDRLDNNTDSSKDAFGGHNYVNFQGRFSAWDEAANAKGGQTWANGVEWTYGANGDVFGLGKAAAGGWKMEVRFKKRMFEDPAAGNKLRNGYIMGFNIGIDDDDKTGPGINGNKSSTQDLAIQYFWANRARYKGLDAAYLEGLTPEERAAQVWRTDVENHPLFIDSTGRLAHGGTGEIIFGYDADKLSSGKILYLCANADLSGTDDASVVALLRAAGYTVTPFTSSGPAGGDDMRAAAVGQDVIMISESLGSGSVLEPIGDPPVSKFVYRDTNIPIISWEAFMWDDAEWTEHPEGFANEFSFFGNTGRSEDTQPEDLKLAFDSLYIKKPSHPIAGGLTGKVKLYNPPYSFNYGKPSADADVIASVRENGEFPSLFVYEKGDKLVDGSVCPNKRIGLFTGQVASLTANWNPEVRWFTEAGKTLVLNTVKYAVGKSTEAQDGNFAGLTGYWRMDEAAGTAVPDSSGKGNHGKIINNAAGAWVTDPERGTVYKATGVNVIDFGALIPPMTTANDFTWSLWIKSDETGTAAAANNNVVFGNRYNAAGAEFSPREFIKFTPSNFEWHFNAADQNVNYTDFVVGKWTHHLVTKQGVKLTYYKDGAESGSGAITGGPKNKQPLYLGGQGTQERWKGAADEVAIFERALSAAEAQQVFEIGKAGKRLAPPPLVIGSAMAVAGNLTITWSGGKAPFKVQKRDDLGAGNWTDVSTTSELSVTVPRSGNAGFYRILGN